MPPIGSIVGQDWLNQNATRKYPLSDGSSAFDVTGSFELPTDLIVDAIIPVRVTTAYDPDGFHLSEVAVFGQGVVLSFSYTNPTNTSTTLIGKVAVASPLSEENYTALLMGIGDFSDVIGKVTIGSLKTIMKFGGVYTFDKVGGGLLSTIIRPDIKGVSALYIRNGSDVSDPIYGDVEIVAGANISLEVIGQQVIINAVDGANLNLVCDCATTTDRTLAPCIRTINGVKAAVGGNITLTGQSCITIDQGINGIIIDDVCAKPCCTNKEVEQIITDLNNLNADVRSQGFTMQQLEIRLTQLSSLADAIAATGFILS